MFFNARVTAASLSDFSGFVTLFTPRTSLITLRVCVPDEETPGLYGFLHVIVHSAKGFKESASEFLNAHVHSLAPHPVTHICCPHLNMPATHTCGSGSEDGSADPFDRSETFHAVVRSRGGSGPREERKSLRSKEGAVIAFLSFLIDRKTQIAQTQSR